ncbi:F-type H+-transporting ATPase subunit a [Metamycoplasma subdolum]|uniref:F-type H+-transporting ATPase subunit a n=1 Tax=Metamycoplasma subdolum TaxID=92407 RepID=A0A3M0A398_9BACT|nr:F0F1 ATP synthase subunit A [Metamycoplasma subdolum]RMA79116.1 F-type H+-transporting ATPase subunit a [Metamycoplasma subdolum]WPB50639.1 F0F1 ATP synthase subunit A [Metamycoplasma subdolum]
MDRLLKLNWFGSSKIQENQIFTLGILIVIVFILSILIYIAIKRQKVEKAPNQALVLVESAFVSLDTFSNEMHNKKLEKANPYFITLFIFFLFGHLLSLFGIAPVGGAVSVVLAATAITWVVTISLNIFYQKIHFFLKCINPLEIAGMVTPIISLTFRMFGNIIGGVVLTVLTHAFLNHIWGKIIGTEVSKESWSVINPLAIIVTPFLNLYFDFFAGSIQAFVFMTLTISYWSQASEENVKDKHRKKIKEWKQEIIKNKESVGEKSNV